MEVTVLIYLVLDMLNHALLLRSPCTIIEFPFDRRDTQTGTAEVPAELIHFNRLIHANIGLPDF